MKQMLGFKYCNKAYNKCIGPLFSGNDTNKKSRKIVPAFDIGLINGILKIN